MKVCEWLATTLFTVIGTVLMFELVIAKVFFIYKWAESKLVGLVINLVLIWKILRNFWGLLDILMFWLFVSTGCYTGSASKSAGNGCF